MKIEVRVWVRTKKYEYACSFMAPETDDDRRQEEYSIKRNKYAESMHSLLWSFLALRATLIMLYFPKLWIYSQRLLCSRHSIGNSRGTRLSVESIIFFFKFVEGQWFEKNHSPSYLEKKNRMFRRSNRAFASYKWSRLSISFVAFKVAFTRSTIVFYVVLRKFTLNNLFCDCVLLCGGLVLPSFTKFESCKNVFKSSSAFRHHFGEPIWCLAIYERNYIHNYKYR